MARKHYSLAYREQIVVWVQLVRSIASVAKEFGFADQTIRRWYSMCWQTQEIAGQVAICAIDLSCIVDLTE